jgi:energy-coupling factor transporter ATP-binding protein EcfA2
VSAPLLELRGIEANYPDGTAALRGLSLVSRGPSERLAVLGANGAGKSSLFLAIAGFLAFRGSASVLGHAVVPAGLAELRRKVGFVFEDPGDQLFLETLGDDVAFGPRNAGLAEPEVAARVREALAAVGLAGFEERSPRRLSSGERRLAAIATALALRPEALVLDEPTANLDARARRRVVGTLARFRGGLILLTHDHEAARELADRAIVLAEGRIVCDAPAASALADPRGRAALGLDESLFFDNLSPK